MLVDLLLLKIKLRLNKIDSQDYDNIEAHYILEAFNKAQIEWARKQLHGNNIFREGDEGSKRRIDDLNVLLKKTNYPITKKDLYYETDPLPADYMYFKRVVIDGAKDCCKSRLFVVYLAEQDNVSLLLRDVNKKPDFNFAETFCTIMSNRVQVYTNNEFDINNLSLSYYAIPVRVTKTGVFDVYTNAIATVDTSPIWHDDVTEIIIDNAATILAGDIESVNQIQRLGQNVENNN